MVYDEGLHFEVAAPRQRRFFSFFKYEMAPDGRNTALSFCHTLMIGWSVQAAHQDSPESDLVLSPPTYDKPEVLGRRQSAVPGAPNQGDCGSCYAITTSTILTSRQACCFVECDTHEDRLWLWIRYFDRDDIFGKMHVSAMQGTSCNVYNQGCAGGYVFLALKFGHEHGFRTQQCVEEYSQSSRHPPFERKFSKTLQQCHDLGGQLGAAVYSCSLPPAQNALPESCKTQIRVSKWHYVGGTFGNCSAEEMQRELWENGPLAVSIEPSVEFTTYHQGVFQSPYNSIVQKGENWAWEKVDHAIVLVGWGWGKHGDSWVPYWKVRNSWGPEWGEDGYARIVRGVNEMAIERVAVAADVLLYEGDKAVLPSSKKHASSDKKDSSFPTPATQESEAEEIHILSDDYSVDVPDLVQLTQTSGDEQTSQASNANSAAGASVSTGAHLRPVKHH
ncbi:hypothetical protein ACSSS7_003340 [Eimeria intestinalis]